MRTMLGLAVALAAFSAAQAQPGGYLGEPAYYDPPPYTGEPAYGGDYPQAYVGEPVYRDDDGYSYVGEPPYGGGYSTGGPLYAGPPYDDGYEMGSPPYAEPGYDARCCAHYHWEEADRYGYGY